MAVAPAGSSAWLRRRRRRAYCQTPVKTVLPCQGTSFGMPTLTDNRVPTRRAPVGRRPLICEYEQLAERLESRAQLGGVQLRLLPGGEVPAPVDLVVVDEVGVCLLRPAPRSLVDLVGEDADGNWDGHVLAGDVAALELPVQPRRGDSGLGQPEERDVVEDIVGAQAFLLPVEGPGDHVQARRVVIEHERRQEDR